MSPAASPAQDRAPIRIGGQALADRVLRGRADLVEQITAHLVREVPFYGVLPREQIDGDIRRVLHRNLILFVDTLRARRPPDDSRLSELVESAALRAEEGVPLESVLAAYHLGMRVAWTRMVASAMPEEGPDVAEAAALMLDHLCVLTGAVTGAYVEERLHRAGQEQAAQRSALAALLEGHPVDGTAETAGLRLAGSYAVLRVAVTSHPDELGGASGSHVAAQRKLRRLSTEFHTWGPGEVLSALGSQGGTVLLPVDDSGQECGVLDRRVDEAVSRVSRRAGAEVRASVAVCERSAVPQACAEADEVLRVVLAQGLPAGTYRLDDVLLEVQLSRPGQARDRLVRLLDPLADSPELLRTLTVYLQHEQNRRRTATLLHVHPNTVDYRLRRVSALTGLDPGRSADLVRLTAALIGTSASKDPASGIGDQAPEDR